MHTFRKLPNNSPMSKPSNSYRCSKVTFEVYVPTSTSSSNLEP
jgi:hypothetical protein